MQLFSILLVLFLSAFRVSTEIEADQEDPTESDRAAPTHFALFMDSVDGTIVNETLYARAEPCMENITAGISTVRNDPNFGTYGSYTWGIGPHRHLFAYLDGRVATCSPTCIGGHDFFGGTSQVVAQTWKIYFNHTTRFPIPTCDISYNHCKDSFYLGCESEGHQLTWSFCGSEIDSFGNKETLNVLSWSTIIAPNCTEVKVRVVEVEKYWGNETYSHTGPYKSCQGFR